MHSRYAGCLVSEEEIYLLLPYCGTHLDSKVSSSKVVFTGIDILTKQLKATDCMPRRSV